MKNMVVPHIHTEADDVHKSQDATEHEVSTETTEGEKDWLKQPDTREEDELTDSMFASPTPRFPPSPSSPRRASSPTDRGGDVPECPPQVVPADALHGELASMSTTIENLRGLLQRGVGFDCAMQSLPESTIPDTVDAAAAMSAIERILQKDLQTKGLQNEGGPQSAASGSNSEEAFMSRREEQYHSALTLDGGFCMRTHPVGIAFQKTQRLDATIRERYKECKSHAAKRKFRAEWVEGEYESLREVRTRATTHERTTHNNGVYRPLKVIFTKEGATIAPS
jgi:hypothetical protein